jgi:hypothetical protein
MYRQINNPYCNLEGSYNIFMNQKKWMVIKSTITTSISRLIVHIAIF